MPLAGVSRGREGSVCVQPDSFCDWQNCRIAESQHGSGWKGPPWLVCSNLPALAGSPQSTRHRMASRRLWNIARVGDSTISLGNLYKCVVTHRVKFFLIFRWVQDLPSGFTHQQSHWKNATELLQQDTVGSQPQAHSAQVSGEPLGIPHPSTGTASCRRMFTSCAPPLLRVWIKMSFTILAEKTNIQRFITSRSSKRISPSCVSSQ
ncbi:uncharacterized protein LOC128792371 [Vidua chalybeata]|uniref:uncharacterized protein LOC128792371 n=1 Tax=Vidua chalybeata TaxID=81927 RepID=UPI0023A85E17|nr:uncharacterized protein LOC128792371 [Vidua chalybeata]